MSRLLKKRETLLFIIIAVMIAVFSTRAQGFATPGNLAGIFNDTSNQINMAQAQKTQKLTKSIEQTVAAR